MLTGSGLMKFATFPGTLWLGGSRLLVFTALPQFMLRPQEQMYVEKSWQETSVMAAIGVGYWIQSTGSVVSGRL